MDPSTLGIALLVVSIVAVLAVMVAFKLGRFYAGAEVREARARIVEDESAIRQDALSRSRSVIKGKVGEHFAPFLPGFRWNPSDARFLGSPVDFIVFDGMSDGQITEIAIVEIKQGTSQLSTKQRGIRSAVQEGRVTWHEVRLD